MSIPGCSAPLARPCRAVCEGFDMTGAPVTVHGTGLLARCLQHETDHLDGLLYIDRLSAAARRVVLDEHAQRQNASACPGEAAADSPVATGWDAGWRR
ncbi:peptide deformylase [Nonomuraea rubra]|uniref:peptide deformylase n=1 Tax=Nonomuraea rubra TaxID=46180 RepID=UPI00360E1452